MARKVPVWDVPTRIFHWVLLALVVFSIVTAKIPGDWVSWHERSGICILILVVFRIIWGFAGGEHARFASFVKSPFAALRYARGAISSNERHLGHNQTASQT